MPILRTQAAPFGRENWFAATRAEPGRWCWTRMARSPGAAAMWAATRCWLSSRRRSRTATSPGCVQDGVSYIFAGEREIDLAAALEILNRELGIGRLLLEGGGAANGALLQAGLVDELSLIIAPSVEAVPGGPAVFDIHGELSALNTMGMALESCQALEVVLSGCATVSRGIGDHCGSHSATPRAVPTGSTRSGQVCSPTLFLDPPHVPWRLPAAVPRRASAARRRAACTRG